MGQFIDRTGMRYGKLTVISHGGKTPRGEHKWLCRCDCGREIIVQGGNLSTGHTVSCGCERKLAGKRFAHDLTGKKYNRLTVLRPAEKSRTGETRWVCRCDCGKETIVQSNNLKSGLVKSCGCYAHDRLVELHTTHGGAKQDGKRTRLYSIWIGMRRRCYEKNSVNYSDYGARGISICDEWRDDFAAFRDWAIASGYKDGLTIDRKNNDGPYCPKNCRWADAKQQARNRRSNRPITFNGETRLISDWEKILGFSRGRIAQRIDKLGWSVERALTEPIHTHNIGRWLHE